MADSFFTRTDADLHTGSQSFSTQITATPTAFGLTAGQAAGYESVSGQYANDYLAAIDPLTRTRGKVAAKNTSRKALRDMSADLAKIIDGTPSVTDEQKIDLGLNVRKTPAPVPAPSVRPGVDLKSVVGRTLTIHVHDAAVTGKRAKPKGTTAAWVYSFIGSEYPSDPSLWNFEGATTKNDFNIVFPNTVAGGQQVWVCAAWINAKQQAGPVSEPISTNIQGGGSTQLQGIKIAA